MQCSYHFHPAGTAPTWAEAGARPGHIDRFSAYGASEYRFVWQAWTADIIVGQSCIGRIGLVFRGDSMDDGKREMTNAGQLDRAAPCVSNVEQGSACARNQTLYLVVAERLGAAL